MSINRIRLKMAVMVSVIIIACSFFPFCLELVP